MIRGTKYLAGFIAPALMLVGCGDETEPRATVPAALVPADASVYVEIESLDALDELDALLTRELGEDVAIRAALDELLGEVMAVDQVDTARPVGMVVDIDEVMEGRSGGAFVAPVGDPGTFIDSLHQPEGAADPVSAEGYVGVPMTSAYETASATHDMVGGMPQGVIAARLDLDALLAKYRPMIDASMDQASAMFSDPALMQASAGMDISAMMNMYFDGFRAVLDSALRLDLSMGADGDQLDFEMALEVREGSSLDGFAEGSKSAVRDVAGYVDASQPFVFFAGMDMALMVEETKPFMDEVFKIYPASMQQAMAPLWDSMGDIYGQMGNGLAGSLDFQEGGMRAVYYMASEDPQAAIDYYLNMLSSEMVSQFGMSVEEAGVVQIAGLDVRKMSLSIDYEKMVSIFVNDDDDYLAPDSDALIEMTKEIYGPGGLNVSLASHEGVVGLIFGGDDEFVLRSMTSLAEGASALPPETERLISRIDEARAGFAMRMDFGQMMAMGSKMVEAMEGTDAAQMPGLSGEPLNVEGFAAIEGRTWRGGFRMDVGEMGGLMSSLRGG